MAARIGKATVKAGKLKPVDRTPLTIAKNKVAKADRIEKGLRANRAGRIKK